MKNKLFKKKIYSILLVFAVCLGMLSGCTGKKDKNGSMKAEDGRSYGGVIEGEVSDTLETAFFDWKVESAEKYDTYQFDDGLYQAEKGKTYLVIKLTVKNTYEEELAMSITDFTLDFEGNKEKEVITGFGKSEIQKKEFMDNVFTLKKGESITKKILFTVKDKKEYTVNYAEYYEDKFKGDTFRIHLEPKMKSEKAKEKK